jgi:hypothetical protein
LSFEFQNSLNPSPFKSPALEEDFASPPQKWRFGKRLSFSC